MPVEPEPRVERQRKEVNAKPDWRSHRHVGPGAAVGRAACLRGRPSRAVDLRCFGVREIWACPGAVLHTGAQGLSAGGAAAPLAPKGSVVVAGRGRTGFSARAPAGTAESPGLLQCPLIALKGLFAQAAPVVADRDLSKAGKPDAHRVTRRCEYLANPLRKMGRILASEDKSGALIVDDFEHARNV